MRSHRTDSTVHAREASLRSTVRTDTFQITALPASNLGEDFGTSEAMTGQLAGTLYRVVVLAPRQTAKLALVPALFENSARFAQDNGARRAACKTPASIGRMDARLSQRRPAHTNPCTVSVVRIPLRWPYTLVCRLFI